MKHWCVANGGGQSSSAYAVPVTFNTLLLPMLQATASIPTQHALKYWHAIFTYVADFVRCLDVTHGSDRWLVDYGIILAYRLRSTMKLRSRDGLSKDKDGAYEFRVAVAKALVQPWKDRRKKQAKPTAPRRASTNKRDNLPATRLSGCVHHWLGRVKTCNARKRCRWCGVGNNTKCASSAVAVVWTTPHTCVGAAYYYCKTCPARPFLCAGECWNKWHGQDEPAKLYCDRGASAQHASHGEDALADENDRGVPMSYWW